MLQLYFYQRILQLRAAQEQEAKNWITCIQSTLSEQQIALSQTAAKPHHSTGPVTAMPSPSHEGKSASAAGNGVLLINARSGIRSENSPDQGSDTRGVLPAHLLVEPSHVSYSPLSEHLAASPFLSDAHMLSLTGMATEPSWMTPSPSHPVSTAEAATSTEDEAQLDSKATRRLSFVE